MTTLARSFLTPRNVAVLLLIALIDAVFIYLVKVEGSQIYRENHLIEDLQCVLLLLGCAAYLVSAWRLQGRHRTQTAFFGILCFIFFFRELDVEDFDVPQIVIFLLADNRGRSIFFLIGFALLGLMGRDYRHYLAHRATYLRSDIFIYLAMAALLLLVGSQMFDRKWVYTNPQALYEEVSEFTAYYLMLVSGLISRRVLQGLPSESAPRNPG
jgi:hypothetical protein